MPFGILKNLESKIQKILSQCQNVPCSFIPEDVHAVATGIVRIDNKNGIRDKRNEIIEELKTWEALKLDIQNVLHKISGELNGLDNNYNKWNGYKIELENELRHLDAIIQNRRNILNTLYKNYGN